MEAFVANKDSLIGAEWTSIGNPTGSKTTFDSQPALVLPFTDAQGVDYFIYLGDRWAYPNLLNASYIWLPITIHSNLSLSIEFRPTWDLSDPFNSTRPSDTTPTTQQPHRHQRPLSVE